MFLFNSMKSTLHVAGAGAVWNKSFERIHTAHARQMANKRLSSSTHPRVVCYETYRLPRDPPKCYTSDDATRFDGSIQLQAIQSTGLPRFAQPTPLPPLPGSTHAAG